MASCKLIVLTAAWRILFFSTLVSAHIRMIQPAPLNGDHDENKNPLGSGNPYPCQGYVTSYPFRSSTKYEAGSEQTLQLEGSATHGGGSCQISLSYDNGTTFRVIESIIGGCTLDRSLTFIVPEDAPTGGALLSWTWFNKMGNREMYQNCAWVSITSASTPPRRLKPRAQLARRLPRTEASLGRSADYDNIIRLDYQGQPAYFPPTPLKTTKPKFERRHDHQRRHGHQYQQKHAHRHQRHLKPRSPNPEAAPAEVAFATRPLLFKANIPQSNIRTDDGCDVIFPHPGPAIKHGQSDYAWCGNPSTGFTRLSGVDGDDDGDTGDDNGDNGNQALAPATSATPAPTLPLPKPASIIFDLSTQTGTPWPFAGTAGGTAGTANPTLPTASPLYPNTTSTTTHLTVIECTGPTPTPTPITTPIQPNPPATTPTQPTAPPNAPGRQDPCFDFGSWRCDQGGYRLQRCNYAADWVYSHGLAWADMGVPPGTRCVLDAQGEPSFVFDS